MSLTINSQSSFSDLPTDILASVLSFCPYEDAENLLNHSKRLSNRVEFYNRDLTRALMPFDKPWLRGRALLHRDLVTDAFLVYRKVIAPIIGSPLQKNVREMINLACEEECLVVTSYDGVESKHAPFLPIFMLNLLDKTEIPTMFLRGILSSDRIITACLQSFEFTTRHGNKENSIAPFLLNFLKQLRDKNRGRWDEDAYCLYRPGSVLVRSIPIDEEPSEELFADNEARRQLVHFLDTHRPTAEV